jgi:RNA polymerase sigma-70 factor (ECF subfamily)
VAEVLGLTVEAVKSRLHRARVAVRQAVAPMLGVPEPAAPAAPARAGGAAPGREVACPDIVALFSRHLEGEISAAVCADMEKHLQGCEACRSRCDSLQRTLAMCRRAPLPEVPEPVQVSVKQALRRFLEQHA